MRLEAFTSLVRRWSSTINLVGRADLIALEHRHLDDCLQLVPLLPSDPEATGIDLGSGAGFPGLVIAIVTGMRFSLIEADKRKAAFLREAARHIDAPVTVFDTRIESTDIKRASLVTARALAPLDKLLGWTAPKLAAGGTGLFLKGKDTANELTQARRHWQMRVEQFQSRTRADGTILRITELSAVAQAS